MTIHLNIDFLQAWAQPKTVVLTPNQRLAQFARRQFDNWQLTNGQRLWEPLAVFPLGAWILQLWQQAFQQQFTPPCLLLNAAQTRQLWRQLLKDKETELGGLASLAEQAWQLTQQWRVPLNDITFTHHEDTQLWQQWAWQWQQQLTEKQWLDIPGANEKVLDLLPTLATHQQLPRYIYLLNFVNHTPWQTEFFESLRQQGVEIIWQQHEQPHNRIWQLPCHTAEQELQQMVQWASNKIATNPEQHIACVIPELNQHYSQIEQLFSAQLPHRHLFDIAMEKPLQDYPLIQHGLLLLELLLPEITFHTWRTLLLSPFITDQNEWQARARWENQLRPYLQPRVSREKLRKYCLHKKTFCPQWQSLFLQVTEIPLTIATSKSSAEWLTLFQKVWEIFGWPGERTLNSEEYQLWQRWQETLTTFASLTLTQPEQTLREAIAHLQYLAQQTPFQAQASAHTRIHIYNMLDAAGLPFDAIWVMGLHDEAWPQHARPHPFIPYALQRRLKMPHATPQQEWEFSKQIIDQLCQATSEIIFSYAQHAEEKIFRPSPFIKNFPLLSLTEEKLTPRCSHNEEISWEYIEDFQGPVLNSTDKSQYGSAIFKDQAACPFQAFSRHRLHARPNAKITMGLTASQRGQLIHAVLEAIWQTLGSQQALLALEESALHHCIETQIEHIQTIFSQRHFPLAFPLFFENEIPRLHKLIYHWLTLEKTREPFTVVATESELKIEWENIGLHLRLDRIDQLANGEYVLIDYKTGDCSIQSWLDSRLDDPQLPLYSILCDLPLSAISFVQIKPEKLKWIGIGNLPGLNQQYSLSELQTQWHQQLQQLGHEYRNGYAAVSPKKGAATCRKCDLQRLCRVHLAEK